MTKFKEYLRSKGIKLECDYEVLPYKNLESVETSVMDDCVMATAYFNITEPWSVAYNKRGECVVVSSYDDTLDLFGTHCDPEYIDWLCHTRYNISTALYPVAVCMYKRDEKVRIAFKHMLAGIMSEEVLYKYIVRQYPKYIRSV